MVRKEAIEKLKQGIIYEESGAAIYSKHLEAVLQWTGLPEEEKMTIHEKISKILEETLHHRVLLGEIVDQLEKKK